ncbi:hypothetical protein [Ralstonia phage RSP15]|uniref:RIIA lysis inhibitor n=1 Tax=Ralstonia phage RSP15 TaxID=1785960 RepID=UPI00074D3190|nr:RIIA lysis inhibitor [Ralstonia phage RSP15]BAU40159.1 hypothetical protein [Ralstonia phage RSP15]
MITHDTAGDVLNIGITGEQKFTMSATGKGFSIVIDKLYSNKIAAVVRELCCNARDAHVEAGKGDVPFEITIPNAIEHNFVVKDYGTGLSPENVFKFLGGIFNSSKEASNDFVGTYGLGSKSPFALTDSYTIESRFNGKKYTFLAFRKKGGEPSMVQTLEEDTDEPNGITFSVPVSDYHGFEREIMNELIMFETRPVFTNRENFKWLAVTPVEQNGHGMFAEVEYGFNKGYVCAIMGGVVYPIDLAQVDTPSCNRLKQMASYGVRKAVFLNFNLGELDVQPSREGLSYDDETKQAIEDRADKFIAVYDKIILDRLNGMEKYIEIGLEISKLHSKDQYLKNSRLLNVVREFDNFPSQVALGGPAKLTLNYSNAGVPSIKILTPIAYEEKTYTKADPTDPTKEIIQKINLSHPKFEEYYSKTVYRDGDYYMTLDKGRGTNAFHHHYFSLASDIEESEKFTILVLDEQKNIPKKLTKHFTDRARTSFMIIGINPDYLKHGGKGDNRDVSELITLFNEMGLNKQIEVVYASELDYDKTVRQKNQTEKVVGINVIGHSAGYFKPVTLAMKDTSEIPEGAIYVLTEGTEVEFNGKKVKEQNSSMEGLKALIAHTEITIYQIMKSGRRYLKHFEEKNAISLDDWLKNQFRTQSLSMEYREARKARVLLTASEKWNMDFVRIVKKYDSDFEVFKLLDAVLAGKPPSQSKEIMNLSDRLYENIWIGDAKAYKMDVKEDNLTGLVLYRAQLAALKEKAKAFEETYGKIGRKLLGNWPSTDDYEYAEKFVEMMSKARKYDELQLTQ